MARAFYFLVATVLGVQGVFYTLADFPIDAVGGVPLALLGVLNVLNGSYGSDRVGMRRTTFGMNVALTLLVLWLVRVPEEGMLRLSLALLLVVTGWSAALTRSQRERANASVPVAHSRRSRWEWLDVSVAGSLVAVGVWSATDDLVNPGFFYGIGVLVGFAYVLFGALNLLDWRYGSNARGIRRTVTAVNVVLLMIIWAADGFSSPNDWHERLMYAWLPAVATMLSLGSMGGRRPGALIDVRPGA